MSLASSPEGDGGSPTRGGVYVMSYSYVAHLHEGDGGRVDMLQYCYLLVLTPSIIHMNHWLIHFTAARNSYTVRHSSGYIKVPFAF